MANLIDADALLKDINDYPYGYRGMIKDTIAIQPTVDAVEVVRCKDCKYHLNSNEKCGLFNTRLHFYEMDKMWTEDCFCSWGERKEDADT